MKAFLMYPARDLELMQPPSQSTADLVQDLDMEALFRAMAGGDSFLEEVATSAVLSSLQDTKTILYRQQILRDCLAQPGMIRQLYALAVEGIEQERKVWHWSSPTYPQGALHRSSEVLTVFVDVLRRMRKIADERSGGVSSEGMRRLLSMLSAELNEEYLHRVEEHLKGLEFRAGLQMSAKLGDGNKGTGYILLKFDPPKLRWYERIRAWFVGSAAHGRNGLTYHVHERDEAGLNMLGQIKNFGIGNVASAVSQSTDHILNFFQMLRLELGFYIGCLNLYDELTRVGAPMCFPEPMSTKDTVLTSCGLYDISLQLRSQTLLIRNDMDGGEKNLIMITGANRGGKSTFLRGIGLAQLMMQCGMFVAAESFRANTCRAVFTHFKRREDAQMKSGKLDEELKRMNEIVDQLQAGDMVLFNESFSSTNEREGSQIAREVVTALLEMGIKVVYVTHMYDLAEGLYRSQHSTTLFLRAERLENGDRTFRLIQGEPLPTSYGADLYQRIFGPTDEREVA